MSFRFHAAVQVNQLQPYFINGLPRNHYQPPDFNRCQIKRENGYVVKWKASASRWLWTVHTFTRKYWENPWKTSVRIASQNQSQMSYDSATSLDLKHIPPNLRNYRCRRSWPQLSWKSQSPVLCEIRQTGKALLGPWSLLSVELWCRQFLLKMSMHNFYSQRNSN